MDDSSDGSEGELERYRAYLESTRDIITVVDSEGIIQYESPAVEPVLGYGPEERVGENGFDYLHPEDQQHAREHFRRALAGDQQTSALEVRVRHKDGSWRWAESRANYHLDDSTIEGVVASVRDITERKRRERRLKQFASVVSHDLRNPLNIAEGHLELARTECESEHLEQIGSALGRMNELVDDTLELARQGQTVGDPEPVTISVVARESWANVETPGATLQIDDELEFHGDPERLRSLFENLFRNAVEHGGADVTVRVGPLDGAGFYVEDDGGGIRMGDVDVFVPGHSTKAEGTGFGLAIVEEIVRAHGWDIRVTESEAGGARFEVRGLASPHG